MKKVFEREIDNWKGYQVRMLEEMLRLVAFPENGYEQMNGAVL